MVLIGVKLLTVSQMLMHTKGPFSTVTLVKNVKFSWAGTISQQTHDA